nr:YcjX family protein [Azospirillum brasilense]
MAFQPPADLAREARGLPHIRLDQAMQFLLGDYLE